MKKVFFLVASGSIILSGCSKKICYTPIQPNIPIQPNMPIQTKSLVAYAGLDTVLDMPQPGTGYVFKGILNGRGSHDVSGKIIFYSWTDIQVAPSSNIMSPNSDSTEVNIFGKGIHKFRLEIRDKSNNVDYDTVAITINQKFGYEYDGLSWDSTAGTLTCLNIGYKPGLIETFPGFTPNYINNKDFVNFCAFNGSCDDVNSWEKLPYVPYDSIYLTDKNIFYSSNDSGKISCRLWTGLSFLQRKKQA